MLDDLIAQRPRRAFDMREPKGSELDLIRPARLPCARPNDPQPQSRAWHVSTRPKRLVGVPDVDARHLRSCKLSKHDGIALLLIAARELIAAIRAGQVVTEQPRGAMGWWT